MTTSTPPTATSDPSLEVTRRAADLRLALHSEWIKFRSLRSNLVLIELLALVLPAFAALIAATGSLQPDDTVLGASVLGGATLAQLLAAAIGAASVTSEYRGHTMRTTLLACPRPLLVLSAKSIVTAAVTSAIVLPASAAAFAVGSFMLDGSYATGTPMPALIGVTVAIASMAVLGVGLGSITRHPAGAVGTIIGVVLVPAMLAPLLGNARRWLGGASLSGVLQKLSQSSDATHESVGSLGAWPSLLVVAAYTAGVVGVAVWLLRRRDS